MKAWFSDEVVGIDRMRVAEAPDPMLALTGARPMVDCVFHSSSCQQAFDRLANRPMGEELIQVKP